MAPTMPRLRYALPLLLLLGAPGLGAQEVEEPAAPSEEVPGTEAPDDAPEAEKPEAEPEKPQAPDTGTKPEAGSKPAPGDDGPSAEGAEGTEDATATAEDDSGSGSEGGESDAGTFLPPKLIEFVQADYPEAAKEEELEASVVLVVDIDTEGKVENVEIQEPAQPEGYGFDEAAMAAVFGFVFEPALENGEPIPVRITYKYNFVFTERATEVPADPTEPAKNFDGLCVERGTKTPLRGVVVTIFQGEGDEAVGFDATTDEEGRFAFYDIPPGDWRILVEAPGFYPYRSSEKVLEGQRTSLTLFVEKASYNPFDVETRAAKPRKEVSRTSLSVTEIEKIPGAAGDPLAVVQNLPGVARNSNNFGGLVVVRGAAPEDTQIFVDGIAVPIIFHFGGLRSVIPAGMLDGIDFYPGNFSSRYGRATGGILDVDIKDLDAEAFDGYVDVSLFDTSVYLEMPIGEKVDLALGGRRSYIDGVLNLAVPDDAPVSLLTAPRYYDYQALLTYRPKAGHKLRTFFFGSDDALEFLFESPSDVAVDFAAPSISTGSRFYRILSDYEWTPSESFSNVLRVSGGRNWLEFGGAEDFNFNVNTYYGQIRDEVSWKQSQTLTIEGGVDYLLVKSDIDITLPGGPPKEGDVGGTADLNQTRSSQRTDLLYTYPAVWTEFIINPSEDLSIIPGLRATYVEQEFEQFSAAPRLAMRWRLADEWTLKGGAGLFVQPPAFDETSPTFGNPRLALEEALQYSLGTEWTPEEHLFFDVTGFYKDLNSLVGRSTQFVTRDGALVPEIYNNATEGRVYGAEFLARHQFNKGLFGWISYTLSRSERLDPGADAYRIFDFDQTHIFTALGTYQLPRNWEVGGRWRYVSGFPATPIVGSVFNSDADEYEPVFGPNNADRIPAFHQLDIRVDKKWIYDRWMLNAYLDIQNIYNRANPEGFTYNFDYSERKVQQGLPLLPILGVRADF